VTHSNGKGPDPSESRFFRNTARKVSLVCVGVAVAALVIGGSFAEISSDGAPTSTETAAVRWVIVAALVVGIVSYVIGGRQEADRRT
jgi:hypothetical protein